MLLSFFRCTQSQTHSILEKRDAKKSVEQGDEEERVQVSF